MKKFFNSIVLGSSLIFGLSSCQEKIDIDVPGGEPKLVIEAEVNSDETIGSYVKLSLSSNYFGPTEYPQVKDAEVTINGVPFVMADDGLFLPPSGYKGYTDSTYNLLVKYNGQTYTATSKLEPMFRVDSFFQVFKPKEGFIPEGYSISYSGFDSRQPIKYTYFQLGSVSKTTNMDSLENGLVLFDNSVTPINRQYEFELPFTRYESGDRLFFIFRSCDKAMYDLLNEYNNQNSGAPGPFQTPPTNLPTNIKGGALGYFATYDYKRFDYTVK
ncbi:MAG: DUF4249 family protein [Bacteroidia bacterium]